jgi:hypothetical protein
MKRMILLFGVLSILALSCVVTDEAKMLIMGPTATSTPTQTLTATPSPTATNTPSPTATSTLSPMPTKSVSQLRRAISGVLKGGDAPEGLVLSGPFDGSDYFFIKFPAKPTPLILINFAFVPDDDPLTAWGIVNLWYYRDEGEAEEMWDGITDPYVLLDYGEFSSNYGQGIDTCIAYLPSTDKDPNDWLVEKVFRPTATTIVYVSFWGGPKDQIMDNVENYEASILEDLIAAVS